MALAYSHSKSFEAWRCTAGMIFQNLGLNVFFSPTLSPRCDFAPQLLPNARQASLSFGIRPKGLGVVEALPFVSTDAAQILKTDVDFT